jgi:hypothetical protein
MVSALAKEDWMHNDKIKAALEKPLMRLCARYLYCEKGRNGAARNYVGEQKEYHH